jgi:hypothetical protein
MGLLVVNEPSACPPVPDGAVPLVEDVLSVKGDPVIRTTKAVIREWCKRDPAKVCPKCKDTDTAPCVWCDGSGLGGMVCCGECDKEHRCVCKRCGGTKFSECSCVLGKTDEWGTIEGAAQGWIAGILVNRDRLARLCSVHLGAPDEPVSVYALKGQTGDRLTIAGGNWKAVLMCIAPNAAVMGAPRFMEGGE